MRYLVIGNTAVLASRNIEHIQGSGISVEVVGVPDGSSLYVQHGTKGISYAITSETASIPYMDIRDEGVYSVTILWTEKDPQTGTETERKAYGNSFQVFNDEGNSSMAILPARLASGTELEKMWEGITNTLEMILPLVDQIKNGNDVI